MKSAHYFIPIFLSVYFFLALLPVALKQKREYFPFFSFKLYSKIPNQFVKYDLLFNKGGPDEYFLIHKNSTLNKLERKNYNHRINIIGSQHEDSIELSLEDYADLLIKGQTVFLIKISGDYINAAKHGEYDIEIIKRLK